MTLNCGRQRPLYLVLFLELFSVLRPPVMLAARRASTRRVSLTRRLSVRAWCGRAHIQGSGVAAARRTTQPLQALVVGNSSLRLLRVPSHYQVPLASFFRRGYAGSTRIPSLAANMISLSPPHSLPLLPPALFLPPSLPQIFLLTEW